MAELVVDAVFKALGDGTRRRILQVLNRHELNVSELVECLDQPQSTVSRHLKVLREASLVWDRKEGASVLYSAQPLNGNGAGPEDELLRQVSAWVLDQQLPKALQRRLDAAWARRRNGSSDFFANIGRRWDQMRVDAFGDRFHLEALAGLLPSEWTVADIGVGTGYMLPILANCFRTVIAVDLVPEMLQIAQATCRDRGIGNVEFRRGDLGKLPLADGEADLAVAMLVIHHVPSPQAALRELARILRPGGRLLVVEQRAHQLAEFHQRMRDRWWGFEADAFAADVAEAGFQDVATRSLETDGAGAGRVPSPELFMLTATRADCDAG